ncbi:hypothetical protein ACFOSC_17980 [Streptantibioticus rubrisoli]|uniref:Uncharacterized protein n=1 Tax=Streptantibioticus rubrisoli TaxID=1387313 RepID=A0ABT1PH44_9ACTN|nr:hypothetical protein [Streptantibioticus rubrisoli]MCQ4044674.1 hypothetical protein [Streptantibioticus rubrisoli]
MKSLDPNTRRGYWCECWTASPVTSSAPELFASFEAVTATQAVRWICGVLRTIASALEPDAADRAWTWLTSGYVAALDHLERAQPCAFTVTHASTRIEWTARPVLFLALAHRQGVNLPDCTERFCSHFR